MGNNKIMVLVGILVLLLLGGAGVGIINMNNAVMNNQSKYDSLQLKQNDLQLKYDDLLLELKSLQETYNNSQKLSDAFLKQKGVENEQLKSELDNIRSKLQQANVKISALEDELEYAQAAWAQYQFLYHRVNYSVELVFIWENYTKPLLFPDSGVDYLMVTYFKNEKITVELLDSSSENVLPEWCFSNPTPGVIRIDLPLMRTALTNDLYGVYRLKISGASWFIVRGINIK